VPRPSIDYLNARRLIKPASGGKNYRRREHASYAPEIEFPELAFLRPLRTLKRKTAATLAANRIREGLKRNFGDIKFTVHRRRYRLVDGRYVIRWADGPSEDAVQSLARLGIREVPFVFIYYMRSAAADFEAPGPRRVTTVRTKKHQRYAREYA